MRRTWNVSRGARVCGLRGWLDAHDEDQASKRSLFAKSAAFSSYRDCLLARRIQECTICSQPLVWIEKRNADPGRAAVRPLIDTHASIHSRTMSSAMATQQFAANMLRTGARSAGRTAPVRAARMTVRAAASNGGLPIDLRGEF